MLPTGRVPLGVLRIQTDEGIEGNNFVSMPSAGATEVAGQILKFFKPILVGDTLTGIARVADIYEKEGGRGGKMTFLAVETTYTNQKSEKVALSRFVLVETGQAVGG